ncbi:MAG: hypothetical protein FWF47_07605 [Clostridia bacterium]|nr:hypothetical protein [Clostridia bacterium]
MKKQWMFLLLILILLLTSYVSPAYADTWPASREELLAENLQEESWYWSDGERYSPAKKWAELWARKNYGEDAILLSTQCVDTEQSLWVSVKKLLDGYLWLESDTWEIQLIPQKLPDDLDYQDGVLTTSIQVVRLAKETEGIFRQMSYLLIGFLPPEGTFHDLFELRTFLHEDPRLTDLLEELRTVVPDDVKEIDLRTVLGDDVLDVEEAWMLNADVCVLVRNPGWDKGYEIILLDLKDFSILSRTPVPYQADQYVLKPGWDGSGYYLQFFSWRELPDHSGDDWEQYIYEFMYNYVRASILPDGTVDVGGLTQNWHTVMPGGKTVIRTADNGSLYAIDLAADEEELLIQGSLSEDSDEIAGYVPFWDELRPEGWDMRQDGFYPFYDPEDIYFSIRVFKVAQPLDEHRFVYTVNTWECCVGYGVYDLQTRTDHRITGLWYFYGMGGDMLYGTTLMANANTYESSPLPESVQEQFAEVSDYMTSNEVNCDISPDGRLLALTGMKERINEANKWWVSRGEEPWYKSEGNTVTITDIRTGDVIKAYDIYNSFATVYSVSFYGDTRIMVFFQPNELGSAYLYFFNIAE